jgi:hypothetical protein
MSVGRVPIGRLAYLNDGPRELIHVRRLLEIDRDAPEYNKERHAGTFYSESWALVHMLMTDAPYRGKVQELVTRLRKGDDAAAAFLAVYGKSFDAIEADLWLYIRKQAYLYFNVPYKETTTAQKLPVRIADGFEAGLVTANLLASSPARETEARAAFVSLSAQKPDDVQLLESRAYFELRHGHRDDAQTPMARAIELGSTNARLYRDYAVMGGVEERRELLQSRLRWHPTTCSRDSRSRPCSPAGQERGSACHPMPPLGYRLRTCTLSTDREGARQRTALERRERGNRDGDRAAQTQRATRAAEIDEQIRWSRGAGSEGQRPGPTRNPRRSST